MASIKRINGKTGVSFKFVVSAGRNAEGKQIRHTKTWHPESGMTERQMEKAAIKAAFEFEQQISQGFVADNRQTFSEYADYVISMKERAGAKRRTVERYRQLMKRINPAIGHLKLTDIKPQHLNKFYKNLSESGIRDSKTRATPKKDIAQLMKDAKLSSARLGRAYGLSPSAILPATHGDPVSLEAADAISAALGSKTKALFTLSKDDTPLSPVTVIEYHRLISTVFSQAEKEMIVLYNPAHRATPPKLEKKEVDSFQPEEVQRILSCLQNEPIKWRTITHLLMVTGCRRGEIMGLRWEAVDWENNQIRIDRALLYSPECGIYESTTKTGDIRYIKVPDETIKLLRQYRAWFYELRFKNGDLWHDTGYMFTTDNGDLINPETITTWLEGFSARHNLPNVHPHKFRHTMASLLISNGTDPLTVSKRLGHATVSTTTDIYSHAIKRADELASDCIANIILKKQA